MLFNRTSSCVAVGFFFLFGLAAPTLGQGPLGCQLFAPADVSTYGGEQEPNEGYFFQIDFLYWSMSAPKTVPIGYPGTRTVAFGPNAADIRVQSNTLDTSDFTSKFSYGQRIEFGRVENNNGWFVSVYQQRDQTQDATYGASDMVFNDPTSTSPTGHGYLYGNVNTNSTSIPTPYSPAIPFNLPVVFFGVNVENAIDTWGVEANYLHRFMTSHAGGTLEMFLDARYYEFNDNFNVSTAPDDGNHTVPSYLGGSYWDTQAENHVVGPQIGLRWFKKQGRWTFNTESRFFAGINCQNITQQVDMGPNLNPGSLSFNGNTYYLPFQPYNMSHTTATHYAYACEFSPAFELRLEGRYQITNAISFHAGWTGMFMAGVARANDLILYQVPAMGIDMNDNRQNLFVNGVTIGFDINR